MKSRNLFAASSLALVALLASSVSFGASKAQIDARAHYALKEFYHINPKHHALVASAKGVLVFPSITKGGVGIGGQFGEGVLMEGGKTVGYYSLTSASVGLTLGLAKHKEILLFTTQAALDKFLNTQGWSAGADTGVALLSKGGAGGEYDTETLKKPVLAFVFGEKGLIGDASVEGSKITQLVD